MKKFFSNLSNKNKLMVCKCAEYGSFAVSLLASIIIYNFFPNFITVIIGILIGGGISCGIEKKFGNEIRKNYLKELSNEYYLNNKGKIDVDKQLKSINVLSRIRYIVKLLYSICLFALSIISPVMFVMSVPGVSVVWGIVGVVVLLANYIEEKIDFSNETITRVIEMAKSDIKDVGAVDDDAMREVIEKRLNCFLPNSYVPLSSQGMKVSATEFRDVRDNWNKYEGDNLRRGPIRARRKLEDKRK